MSYQERGSMASNKKELGTTSPVAITKQDQERIDKMREKRLMQSPSVFYEEEKKKSLDENTTNNPRIGLKCCFQDNNLTDMQKYELSEATMAAATGSASSLFSTSIFNQACTAFVDHQKGNSIEQVNALQEGLLAMEPADEYEGMLISRLIVLHRYYMTFMARADAPNQNSAGCDLNINRATKLMRVYNETLDALNKYRRKGEQKVKVEHQHNYVNAPNGQVVVGDINRGRGT
jgi:hypothetical protein